MRFLVTLAFWFLATSASAENLDTLNGQELADLRDRYEQIEHDGDCGRSSISEIKDQNLANSDLVFEGGWGNASVRDNFGAVDVYRWSQGSRWIIYRWLDGQCSKFIVHLRQTADARSGYPERFFFGLVYW